ncbi:MAG TPA: cyclodeaminase/cyclohydrolase family protein [Vicinamibacterales bacterium]|nr:cyclodeaminase/cyclohydrolase family protein [Vicinamibacterales bacterium]
MTLVDKPLSALLEDFRSPAPTPGGGSASAIAGALGASLLAMVAGLAKPRAVSHDDVQKLREGGDRCAGFARRLEALVDADSDAYSEVVAAYRLPKAGDAEKSVRTVRIQEALKAATEAPLEVMRLCSAAMADADLVRELGNANASSDVGVAIELLRAGRRGARLNVEINLDSVNDQAYATAVRDEIARLEG